MQGQELLRRALVEGHPVREVRDGIYSILPEEAAPAGWDRRAAAYDAIIGSPFYNRLMYGFTTASFGGFCLDALSSSPEGWHLDAGCGSLVFTSHAYADRHERPVVLLDRSLSMLVRARDRLIGEHGSIPENLVLVQGDLLDLPFRPATFHSIQCLNVLHLPLDGEMLLGQLAKVLGVQGRLHLSSLVQVGRRTGDGYMRLLAKHGELATPRRSDEVEEMVSTITDMTVVSRVEGNMAFLTCERGNPEQ